MYPNDKKYVVAGLITFYVNTSIFLFSLRCHGGRGLYIYASPKSATAFNSLIQKTTIILTIIGKCKQIMFFRLSGGTTVSYDVNSGFRTLTGDLATIINHGK